MADIHVAIAGRSYRMACDEGQEDHLRALAARLDLKIAEMRVRFGEIGDQRIAVMAAITLADEATEAEQRSAALSAELNGLRGSLTASDAQIAELTDSVVEALARLTQRIDRITATIGSEPSQPR